MIQQHLYRTLLIFNLFNFVLPDLLAFLISSYAPLTHQQRLLTKCFSLILLGMFLATLATLNFSLAFLIGLLASPLSFFGVPPPEPPAARDSSVWGAARRILSSIVLHALAPGVVLFTVCTYSGVSIEEVLTQAAFGWNVSGLWTQVIVWCVWWPAWLVGGVFVSPYRS